MVQSGASASRERRSRSDLFDAGGVVDGGYAARGDVAVVECADLWKGNDALLLGQLDGAWLGRIRVEREVRARAVVVAEVAVQTTTEVSLVQDDHVVEELAADGADDALGEGFCQGERGAVRTSAMRMPFVRRRNSSP
jgi:hypothetical protein